MSRTIAKRLFFVCVALAAMLFLVFSVCAKESYSEDDTWTYNGNTYDVFTDCQRKVYTYYVGGDGASDSNDGLSESTSFATLYKAVTTAQAQKYLSDVTCASLQAEGATINEVKIVILGDTTETKALPDINGGILTIVAGDGADATVHVGTSSSQISDTNYFQLRSSTKNNQNYIQFNLGAPDMNGTLSFDLTYFETAEWRIFVRVGNDCAGDNIVASMYDGITIKNCRYDDKLSLSNGKGSIIMQDTGTFYMYGGKITHCNTSNMIISVNRGGNGIFIYGGEISGNIGRALKTGSENNSAAKKGLIVIYDCLIENNYTKYSSNGDVFNGNIYCKYGKLYIYGGTIRNNYGTGGYQIYKGTSTSTYYISDKANITFDNTNTFAAGQTGTITSNYDDESKITKIKSTVLVALDGSAEAYGYYNGKYSLKDNGSGDFSIAIDAADTNKLSTQKTDMSCQYLLSSESIARLQTAPTDELTSSVSYWKDSDSLIHSYFVTQTVEPTATENGYNVYTCNYCGSSYNEVLYATSCEHEYIDVVTDPTCTEQGYTTHTCTKCGYSHIISYTPALGHDYTVETVPATCVMNGTKTYTCTRCSDNYTEILNATGHTYIKDDKQSTAPTSSTVGKCVYVCSVCTDTQERKEFPSIKDADVTVTVNNNEEEKTFSVKASDIFNYTETAVSSEADSTCTLNSIKEFTYDGVKYTKGNITAISIPLGVTKVPSDTSLFKQNTSLKKVDLSKAEYCDFSDSAFYKASNIDEIKFGSNQKFGYICFEELNLLEEVIFGGEKEKETVEFGQYCFKNCTGLKKAIFNDSVEIICSELNNSQYGSRIFTGCGSLNYLYLGESVTELNNKPFDNMRGLQTLIIKNMQKLKECEFCLDGSESGSDVDVLRVYIYSDNLSLVDNKCFLKRSGIIIYSNAPITNSGAFNSCNATTKTVNGESVSYPKYTIYYGIPCPVEQVTIPATCSSEGYTTYQYNHPYGDKELVTYDENNELVYKIFEGALTNGTAKETLTLSKTDVTDMLPHTLETISSIVYSNGFDANGLKNCICSVCSQNYTEEADVIFTANGFAILTGGEVYISFSVNNKALNDYKTVNGLMVRYGVFASNGNIEFASDGSISEGTKAIWAEINPESEFTRYGITITGLNNDSYNTKALAYGSYTIDSDNNVRIIQKDGVEYDGTAATVNGEEGVTVATTSVNTITYNKINELINGENGGLVEEAALPVNKYYACLCA